MKRVLVIGSCGAGKSSFSQRLHKITALPVIHLDRYYWKPGWVEPPKEEWKRIVADLIDRDEWIIDGNYGGTMEMRINRADTVFWLDMSRHLCVSRIVKRTLLYKEGSRPDMADGCDERFKWDFMRYVWNFRRDKNPIIEKRLAEFQGPITVRKLESAKSVREIFNRMQAEPINSVAPLR